VQDKERKVNLLSFDRIHLYSDVAWSCGRRTHNPWQNGREDRYAHFGSLKNRINRRKKLRMDIDDARRRNTVDRRRSANNIDERRASASVWTDFQRAVAVTFFFITPRWIFPAAIGLSREARTHWSSAMR
jgi:hypothetical protein